MKYFAPAVPLLLLLAPVAARAAEQILPAGSILSCTISEPKLSSKTADIGDPVLCQVSPVERYGRSILPFNSYLEGRFEDYKDPGHLVGKGWMELKFDRMVIQPGTVVPLSAKVVNVPGYPVDREGRIQGKGHPVRDIVEWSIPILWPLDLINLPRRGPRPTLKEETKLTLKVMDDAVIPVNQLDEPQRDPSGLMRRAPATYYAPPVEAPPPPRTVVYNTYAPPPPYAYLPPPPPPSVVILRNGYAYRTIIPRY